MKRIFIFGSEDFDFDSSAVNLINHIKENFKEVLVEKLSRPEQIMNFLGTDFIIIDAAKGIEKPIIIRDVNSLNYRKKITAHDMDLGSFLKTLHELGELKEVKIIALPNDKEPITYVEEVMKLIKELL